MGQKSNGSTVNATVSMNAAGQITYDFNDTFDSSVSLGSSTGLLVDDTASGGDDLFSLQNSTSDTLNGGSGNDTFVLSDADTSLNDVINGGKGLNVIELRGSGTFVDLTASNATTSAASSGIEAVVAEKALSGESVNLNLGQLSGSTLTDAGAGPGRAFVALIGVDGQVSVNQSGQFTLAGVLNAAGQGFAADGTALDAADTAALAAEVTGIGDVDGTLVADYAGAKAKLAPTLDNLNAYVFVKGSVSYTVWTDGTVTVNDANGDTVTAYQPATSVAAAPADGTVTQFTKAGTWASAAIGVNAAGLSTLSINDGSSIGYAAEVLKGVTGAVFHGDNGTNGGDWFGLGGSGGGNYIYGSPASDIFDLQQSTALSDFLIGGKGFNIVQAPTGGTDVDLTANNATTATAATGVGAVVSDAAAAKAGGVTVEIDPTKLAVTTTSGAKTAVFEAMIGTPGALTLEGAGTWVQAATWAPGAALPTGATALTDASALDALYGSKSYTAETTLTGYLFEQIGSKGAVLKYVTVYTDGALVNDLTAPSAAVMAQAMAQFGATQSGAAAPLAQVPATHAVTLAAGR